MPEADRQSLKWLYVTVYPWPLTNGTALRVWHMARALVRMGDKVSLLASGSHDEFAAAYRKAGVEVLSDVAAREPRAEPPPQGFSPFPLDPHLGELVAEHAAEADVVVLAGAGALQQAPHAAGAGCVVADMVDDPVLEQRSRLWQGASPRMWLRRLRILTEMGFYESRFVSHIALATFVSSEDASSFQGRHPDLAVMAVPNGVDLDHFAPVSEHQADPQSEPTVTFVGNFAHLPNETAAAFLVHEVAPLVWRDYPDARFVLVGADPSEEMQGLASERVEVTGRVDDVRTWLAQSWVVALPMLTGTGIKNKLLEAWASARSVVATQLACQGVPAGDGENVLVADSPVDMAASIVRLLRDEDLRLSLGRAGRDCVERAFSWTTVTSPLRAEVLRLRGRGENHGS